MLKLCSCFKADNDNRKNDTLIKKETVGKFSAKQNTTTLDFLLFGDDESGKTKVIKALVGAHDPFTREEKILKISAIESFIRDSLTDVLRAFKQSNSSGRLARPAYEQRMTYILTTAHQTNFEYPIEFFEHVQILWGDSGLQAFLKKSNTYRLSDFLDRVSKIRDPNYFPSTEDMIYSRLFSSEVFEKSFDVKAEGLNLNLREMNLLQDEEQELIQSFDNKTNTIIFIADCSSFDEMVDEKGSYSRLHQSIALYTKIRNNKLIERVPGILILNKQDLLAKKIKNGARLENYFPDFSNYVIQSNGTDNVDRNEDAEVTRAKYFIKDQFLSINYNNCSYHFTNDNDITLRLLLNDCRALHQ